MMFDIFTDPARQAIVEAQAEAVERGDATIGTEHLLLGLLRETSGPAATVLDGLSVTLDAARVEVDALVGPPPPTGSAEAALATIGIDLARVQARLGDTFGEAAQVTPPTPFAADARAAIELALAESQQLGLEHVDTEHELLGIAQVAQGHGVEVLRRLGVDVDRLVADLRALNRE